MTTKSVAKVGTFNSSVLVTIEYRENSSDSFPIFRAFNFNLDARSKGVIGAKEASWFPMWHFMEIAHFESHSTPDVVFG